MTRVCPNPIPWNDVYNQLSKVAENQASMPRPPVPLILNGWVYSNDAEKMARWNQTVEWAKKAGCEEITNRLSDDDYYFSDGASFHCIGPLGGPMYRDWNTKPTRRPEHSALEDALRKLRASWAAVASGIAEFTEPIAFTGKRARRLLVVVTKRSQPPWGDWDRLSCNEEKRRKFTVFRRAVNDLVAPLEVDHIDFKIESIESPNIRREANR